MSDLKIAVPGLDFIAEQSTAQFQIPAGAGATFAVANNIATITTNAAHGLTFSPAANVLPNYFIQISGATALTGTGTINGPIFRILSIPTTTTFTIYTTVTAATMTAAVFNPVFFPVFLASLLSTQALLPSATPFPYYGSAQTVNCTFGANCLAQYNPDNTNIIQDAASTIAQGGTLAAAPTMRTLIPASSQGQVRFGPQDMIVASGTTATSRISLVE